MSHSYYWFDEDDGDTYGKIDTRDNDYMKYVVEEMYGVGDLDEMFYNYLFEKRDNDIIIAFINKCGLLTELFKMYERDFLNYVIQEWHDASCEGADEFKLGDRTFTMYMREEE